MVYLPLSALQLQYDRLQPVIKKHALRVIASGRGHEQWLDTDQPTLAKRMQVEDELKIRLMSTKANNKRSNLKVMHTHDNERSINFEEGDWFAVPLEERFAIGLIARMSTINTHFLLFGYFFQPIRTEIPNSEELERLHKADAILLCKFDDDFLRQGRWSKIGHLKNWSRQEWPLVDFVSQDPLVVNRVWKRVYHEDDLFTPVEEFVISSDRAEIYPKDVILTPTAVEDRLTRLLIQN